MVKYRQADPRHVSQLFGRWGRIDLGPQLERSLEVRRWTMSAATA